jgi:hypothetical protein
MSVIGISPSDIVAGGKAIGKAVSAIRDGGSRYSFQEADGSVRDRITASKFIEEHFATSSIPSSNSTALVEAAKQLCTRDQAFRRKHDKYNCSLGPHTASSRYRQAGSALKWAFKGEKDLEEHNNRVAAAVDATILHSIL